MTGVQTCALPISQMRNDIYEGVCRIPMITSAKEEQRMITTCRKVRETNGNIECQRRASREKVLGRYRVLGQQ